MKDQCLEYEPLLARRADDDLDAPTRARLEAHLAACPACRVAARIQDDVREVLSARADGLRQRAPEALRARIATRVQQQSHASRWRPFRLPMAATATLTLLVVLTYGLTSSSATLLAAQLALDHLKCVAIVEDGQPGGLDPHEVGEQWSDTYHWHLEVPTVPPDVSARLIGARRCLYGHGHLAHLLYEMDGRVVSLFVMPRSEHPAGDTTTWRALFGQQARVWGEGDHTLALVADADAPGLDRLAAAFGAE